MDISNVSQILTGLNQPAQTNAPIPGAPPVAEPTPVSGDIYNQGEQAPETFTIDRERVGAMWNQHQERVDSFRRMIETLLNQQAERQGLADGWSLSDIEITPEMRAEASEMIADGGYFSVEETAARMLDFAVALTGGDPAQIDVMRDAVQRGFNQAERMFGGELPQISHDTLQAVMNGFDEWAAAGSASAITLLNR